VNGGTPDTNIPRFWTGTIPWVTGADFANQALTTPRRRITEEAVQRSATHVVKAGNILLVTRTGVGKVAIAPFDVAISQDITGVYFSDRIDVRFIYYCLQSHLEAFKQLNQGTSINGILKDDFLAYSIDLPPVPEQRKIARILTALDNLIEKTEALIAKYQAMKQGMMHDLFNRGVDEHGHLRPSYAEAPELYKESELGWIPKEWAACRVDEAGSVRLGRQRSPKHQSGRFTTPYLRVANVFDGFIDYSDVLEMDFTPAERDTYSVQLGDVILNEGQSIDLVGRSAIYDGEPNRYCFQNTLIRFRALPPNDPRYCRGVFKHWLDTGRFTTVARQTTSVAHLGADRLAQMNFPLPLSQEQLRIATILTQQEKGSELERLYMQKLVKQKTGLMQDLLTGKVQVKVDEAEEVAAHA
jgi:type I restriction enzyme S subunit